MAAFAFVLLVAAAAGGREPGGGPLTAPGPRRPGPTPAAAAVYVVQPGDTLWAIARRVHPSGDVRPLVQRLARATGGRPLRAGQRVEIP